MLGRGARQGYGADVAPTVLWLLGRTPPDADGARALLPASDGRVLCEAFLGGE